MEGELRGFARVAGMQRLPKNGVMLIALEIGDNPPYGDDTAKMLAGRGADCWFAIHMTPVTKFEVMHNAKAQSLNNRIAADPMGENSFGKVREYGEDE